MSFVCHLRMLAYWYVSTNKNYCLIYNITISYTLYDWVRVHVFCTPSRGAGAANCTGSTVLPLGTPILSDYNDAVHRRFPSPPWR